MITDKGFALGYAATFALLHRAGFPRRVAARKPSALAGATALATARAAGTFTDQHQRFWDAARKKLGDGPGTRALVGVLLHRTLPAAAVTAGMAAAITAGQFEPDIIAVYARTAINATTAAPTPVRLPPNVSGEAAQRRPVPDLAGYDQLLTGVSA